MPDRSEDLRNEAARCLESAARSTDPARAELIRLSQVFLELAKSAQADFGPIAETFSKMMKEPGEPAVHQQQKVQPKKEE